MERKADHERDAVEQIRERGLRDRTQCHPRGCAAANSSSLVRGGGGRETRVAGNERMERERERERERGRERKRREKHESVSRISLHERERSYTNMFDPTAIKRENENSDKTH